VSEQAVQCVQAARGPLVSPHTRTPTTGGSQPTTKEVEMPLARVGHEAPDLKPRFVGGGSSVKLSDYRGRWW
jgi:hypothetical protein